MNTPKVESVEVDDSESQLKHLTAMVKLLALLVIVLMGFMLWQSWSLQRAYDDLAKANVARPLINLNSTKP